MIPALSLLRVYFALINTNAIIPVSSRGAKKIPSLCSEQAVRSRLYRMRLPRCTRNGGLPRPFRARNDIVKKIYYVYISTLYKMFVPICQNYFIKEFSPDPVKVDVGFMS